jgi:hypothetical protein
VTATDPPPASEAEIAEKAVECVRLLQEYTEKMGGWNESARALAARVETEKATPDELREWASMSDRFDRIYPGFQDLSGIASGLIEQSRVEYLLRTELRLRLAEFENALVEYLGLFKRQPQPKRRPVVPARVAS